MLTDTKLKNLKGSKKLFKVTDRDGLYVAVSPKGTVTFRLDYRLNGRRETLTIGRYGPGGMSLAEARAACLQAKENISAGQSPAKAKQREKRSGRAAKTFGEFTEAWLKEQKKALAPSTYASYDFILHRWILPKYSGWLLPEITSEELRLACELIRDAGAPSAALRARSLVHRIYNFAATRGVEAIDPTSRVKAASIAVMKPRTRVLGPEEVKAFLRGMKESQMGELAKTGLELLMLTFVRKTELRMATRDELDLDNAVWRIPGDRMKKRRPHNVYLSTQAVDRFQRLADLSPHEENLLPGCYGTADNISAATWNTAIKRVLAQMEKKGVVIPSFAPHDLRRTASTALHEAGFNPDWVEKCLAHEKGDVRMVYNRAEYEAARRHVMQEWANILDAWRTGEVYRPRLVPPELMLGIQPAPVESFSDVHPDQAQAQLDGSPHVAHPTMP